MDNAQNVVRDCVIRYILDDGFGFCMIYYGYINSKLDNRTLHLVPLTLLLPPFQKTNSCSLYQTFVFFPLLRILTDAEGELCIIV
jgi:hypothetical protein